MKRGVIILLTVLLLAAFATAQDQYHLTLLAVQETDDGLVGSSADLYLELIPGNGRVFLDTFPATKVDTQFSTRFAKEIACKHFKLDCNRYDFIYTIKSDTSIIGGPSAGAAMAALTTIAVSDLDYTEEIAITGTINSGAIIGPVGGVKQKIEAAAGNNLKKVLIAKGTAKVPPKDNETEGLDLIAYGKDNLSIDVEEVLTLDEVVFQLTGEELNNKPFSLEENPQYQAIMKGLQEALCQRTGEIEADSFGVNLNNDTIKTIAKRKASMENSTSQGDYYSAASFCFANNIQLKREFYQHKQLSPEAMLNIINGLSKKVDLTEEKVRQEKIETISDLQALMVVQERLHDVRQQVKTFTEDNLTKEEQYNLLAYAEERFYSALAWMQFFNMDGARIVVDDDLLKISCQQKISEAEERYQYASLFLSQFQVGHLNDKNDEARAALNHNETALCLIIASQAKADANAILSSFGLTNETEQDLFNSKKEAAGRIIFENSQQGVFPILGYSYYQYAQALQTDELPTSLVYLEYALEMSDFSIYFPEEMTTASRIGEFILQKEIMLLLEGFALGVLITLVLVFMKKKK
ncbi:hypothetical protein COV20_02665 [Candidatus Woesearchaeota archaeon CG10_big_fil_rev_8_21_14_0_10_45_16]|nr:MAG: hypothetical protein COV20_02665 [Candidatus Woesearchaeota archaeon CG10_big_fil_rev_8_21_14_0_10_45_16]